MIIYKLARLHAIILGIERITADEERVSNSRCLHIGRNRAIGRSDWQVPTVVPIFFLSVVCTEISSRKIRRRELMTNGVFDWRVTTFDHRRRLSIYVLCDISALRRIVLNFCGVTSLRFQLSLGSLSTSVKISFSPAFEKHTCTM